MTIDATIVPEKENGSASPAGRRLEELYRSERSSVLRLAIALTGDRWVAEEIVQDAFLELSRRWERLDNPAGYLRTAVANRSRSHHRRLGIIGRRRPPPVPLTVDVPELDELWAVLARLPHRRRVALVLRFYEDLSINDIARTMHCRPGTVSSLLHRGLKDLREVLSDDPRS